MEDDWVPVESLLEPQGSGRKFFPLPPESSFFFCSFCKHNRIYVKGWTNDLPSLL